MQCVLARRCGASCARRALRPSGDSAESGWRWTVDSLAVAVSDRPVGSWKYFLLCLSVYAAKEASHAWLPAGWHWPKRLTNKWPAVALLMLFFSAYGLFALWDSPWWTAWLVIGYFGAAFVIDCLFRGAPFCRYVCPIGQFNFVYSLVSPLEVKVRDAHVCTTCESHACFARTRQPAGLRYGIVSAAKAGKSRLHILPSTACELSARKRRLDRWSPRRASRGR